jgi:hypothetical protein
MTKSELARAAASAVKSAKVFDIHTHLFAPEFGGLALWGIDELLTYHYLVCEAFLHAPMPYEKYWAMPKPKQAEYIWDTLFEKHTPVSEATRGVVTTLKTLGFDPRTVTFKQLRKHFASTTIEEYTDTVFKKANLEAVVMTNDVLDTEEQSAWATLTGHDPRFLAAMRVDGLLNNWPAAATQLSKAGYKVKAKPDAATCKEVGRFLAGEADKMSPIYMAASFPPTFAYPERSDRGTLIDKCILPFSRERQLPFAMMIGVKREMNPPLRMAGDGSAKADIEALQHLCARNPDNKFLVTYLARENQHELCVAARKFHNLMVFGCWWFLNVPSQIAEITTMRLELLGTRFIPQHSDARVLDQLIYKWDHSRTVIADALTQKYAALMGSGWKLTKTEIRRDTDALFGGNFKSFVGL